MQPLTRPVATMTRRVALALAASALLPPQASAQLGWTHGRPIIVTDIRDPSNPHSQNPFLSVHLTVLTSEDGSASVRGSICRRGDRGRDALVADREGARASFGNVDGDGTEGLVRLETDFRDPATGERVHVVLTTPDEDIDASGIYTVNFEIGDEPVEAEVRVRLGTDRSVRRGRKQSKRGH